MNNVKTVELTLSAIYSVIVVFLLPELTPILSCVLIGLCLWNIGISALNAKKPSALLANLLAFISLIVMIYDIGFNDTVTLFVTMLILSSVFKLLQAKTKKHYQSIALLSFFSLSTVYLFSQTIITTVIISTLYIVNLAVLALIESKKNVKAATKRSFTLFLLALPLAVFLLLFLPKLPAFWQLPGPKLAKTGLSDTINPFEIAKLSQSNERVFRAKLTSDAPPLPPFYWRAIIHDQFKESTWVISDILKSQQRKNYTADTTKLSQTRYTIIAEPSAKSWLYGLSNAFSKNPNVLTTPQGLLQRKRDLSNSLHYKVKSTAFRPVNLSKVELYQYTHLPNSNQKTAKLAQQLFKDNTNDTAFYDALKQYFSDNNFSYTLTPTPIFGSDTIDQFMFENKRGFCGHFASAAAFMFRSVGIPARVVSGYLGAELSKDNNYLSIYQYDAHAWVEVYIKDKGWQIFDATAVVSPERLRGSLSQLQSLNDEFTNNLAFSLLRFNNIPGVNWLRLNLENLDYKWTSWVLGFDQQKQRSFLNALFGNLKLWVISLFVIVTMITLFISYFIYLNYSKNKEKNTDVLAKCFLTIEQWCQKQNFTPPDNLTPLAYLSLAGEHFNSKQDYFIQFAKLYAEVRYKEYALNKQRKKHAKALVKLIKTKRL